MALFRPCKSSRIEAFFCLAYWLLQTVELYDEATNRYTGVAMKPITMSAVLASLLLTIALTSLARVRERVARGGHDIPAPIIMRRYAKSLANLPRAIDLADRTFILDNTGPRHRLLATIDNGQVRHQSSRIPE